MNLGKDPSTATVSLKARLGFLAVIVLILGVLFLRSFTTADVVFSNDGPLGGMEAQFNRLPAILSGIWQDLNFLGNQAPSPSPTISTALRFVTSPLVFSKIYCPAALLVLGLCAWYCFRRLGFAPVPCALGALAAMLNSSFFSVAAWGVAGHTILVGTVFLAIGLLSDANNSLRWPRIVLAGFAVGLGVMEGFDLGALFSLVVAAFVAYQALISEGPMRRKIARGMVSLGVVAVCAAVVAAHALSGLIATQIKGVAGAGQDTQSKQQRWDWATQWSLPKAETLGFMIPGLYGYRMDTPGGGNYWGGVGRDPAIDRWMDAGRQGEQPGGFMRFSGGGFYSGLLVVLVGAWAIFQSLRKQNSVFPLATRRWIWFWSAVMFVSLLLAFGRFAPFYQLLYALPYFSTIRNPAKFTHILNWALVILFGYGLQAIWLHYMSKPALTKGATESFGEWFKRLSGFERRWAFGMLGLVGISALGWLIFSSSRPQFEKYLTSVQFDPATAASIARFSIGQVGWYLLFLAVAVGLLLMVFSGRFRGERSKWGGVLLGVFLVVDLARANLPWIVYLDVPLKYATNPVVDRLSKDAYQQRVAILPRWMHQVFRAPPELAVLDDLYRVEWAQHLFWRYNIQSLDLVQMPRMPEDMAAFEGAFQPRQMTDLPQLLTRRWELTNTRYLLGPADYLPFLNQQIDPVQQRFRIAERFNIVGKPGIAQPTKLEELTASLATNGTFALIEFTGALPRAKLYAHWQVNTNDQAVLKQLAAVDFNPATNVLISTATAPPEVTGGTNATAGTVEFTSYAPKHLVLKANARVPAILLLNDRYDPNWVVTVDGKPETLLKANYIMRGVHLAPGEHTVEFRFAPSNRSLYVSLAACAIALALVAFLTFVRDDAPATATETPAKA
jgi:hypothetical protein